MAVSMQVPMKMMTLAHAYGVGNIEAVQALLQLLPSLGKLKRRSAGTIRSVKVSRCAADACFWFRRVLPADADLSQCGGYVYVPMLSPVRAPYWQRENSVNALMPVASELVLCAG
ncbi:MAG: hypothetical protein JNM52_01395 [Betaproteobacteria bacterium]|nr:hypothetical protein [Betaproteobacteria bacterium]